MIVISMHIAGSITDHILASLYYLLYYLHLFYLLRNLVGSCLCLRNQKNLYSLDFLKIY